jgi:hypothetical protein
MRALSCLLLALPAFTATTPSAVPRARICINGAWEAVLNAPGGQIPHSGWTARRAPEMPIAANPPATSIWYRRTLHIPAAWIAPNRQFILHFDKIGHYAAVYWDGTKLGEHFGQFTPFEFAIPASDHFAGDHQIAVFVHNSLGPYVRPGASLDDPLVGNAYRGATDQNFQRNWIGIVGDVDISWRPSTHIDDVFVIPSVRRHRFEARVATSGLDAGYSIRAAVLDHGEEVLALPSQPAASGNPVNLQAAWSNPVLWGPPPYGQPKLYTLRTELLKNGKVVDRRLTRFGFREVWIEGRDVLLNGKKLWMAGTYFGKLTPIRYINERHAQSQILAFMQSSGLNTLHSHWDEAGEAWLDRCDEMGMLVLGAFVCDGRPLIQSKADPGWNDWMAATGRDWVRANRHHPSIVMWRPMDVVPPAVVGGRDAIWNKLAEITKQEDGTRPLADGSDIAAWAQNAFRDPQDHTAYDDGSRMAKELAASTKPFLTKELYTGFSPIPEMTAFFSTFYEKAFNGGGTGLIVQHLPLVQGKPPAPADTPREDNPASNPSAAPRVSRETSVKWFSQSGEGNRPETLPNVTGTPTPFSTLFADLYTKFTKQSAKPLPVDAPAELLVSHLDPTGTALLLPADPAREDAVGVSVAQDGTAWLYAPSPGEYVLLTAAGSSKVNLASGLSRH